MRDRKRKIPDRKSAVSDLAKSFSFREQKLSYVRSKNRLGFTCGVSCIPFSQVQMPTADHVHFLYKRTSILVLWYNCTCRKLLLIVYVYEENEHSFVALAHMWAYCYY